MYNNDYIMRMIEDLSAFLANVIFQKDVAAIDIFDEQGNFSQSNFLHVQLLNMIGEGRINEAENLLFEKIAANLTEAYLKIGIDFYQNLERLSDATLNNCGFSQDEIVEGLNDLKRIVTAKQQPNN